jgi:type VI secretion system protein ImpK
VNTSDPNNPMQDPDRTVLVPAPGGRRNPAAQPPAADPGPSDLAPTAPRPAATDAAPPQLHGTALNPLVRAANPLLDLVTPLRHMVAHPDVEALRMQLIQAVKAFEASAKAARVEHESIAAARYALCTLLDETISSTPWGGGGVWASRSLLVAFHNEAFGGEKFFLILQKLGQDARANLFTLELMYLCLALGLEGRYRVIEGGRSQLEVLRERLQLLIAQHREPVEPELSVHWKGASGKGEPLWRVIPVWILAAAAGALLIGLQLFFSQRLNKASDPVFANLLAIKAPQAPAMPAPAVAPPPAPARLAAFLAPEIARGTVSVVETADRSTVTLHGDGLFGSGSGDVTPAFLPLLQRIGDALKTVPGKVIVVGHTDNVKPGLSAKFPSNFDLSKGRAGSVRDLLAERAGPAERYTVEGRGDSEPLVPNDSVANRGRNRRVDIIVLTPAVAP